MCAHTLLILYFILHYVLTPFVHCYFNALKRQFLRAHCKYICLRVFKLKFRIIKLNLMSVDIHVRFREASAILTSIYHAFCATQVESNYLIRHYRLLFQPLRRIASGKVQHG